MNLMAVIVGMLVVAQFALASGFAQVQPDPERPLREPILSVSGRGEVSARPDRATVILGAVVQSEQASEAQRQVNAIMQRAFDQIKAQEIPDEAISTVGLSLEPVYSRQPPRGEQPHEPRIVGFRARNAVRIRVDDLMQVGPVIDAGIAAGANELQGLHFELRDDREARREALRMAVEEAQLKAETISEAMGLHLEHVQEVAEAEVGFRPPQVDFRRDMMMPAADMATPVQPGQLQVEARVVVRYRIGQ